MYGVWHVPYTNISICILLMCLLELIYMYANGFLEGGVNYWLSGMGAYCCYKPSNKDKVPAGKFSLFYLMIAK